MPSPSTPKWRLDRPPNIDDLRSLECFICREEETRTNDLGLSDDKIARKWVHACSCKLVAHESCLLSWIATSQAQKSSDASQNALRCPQCKARYILESDNPLVLQVMDGINGFISRCGRWVALSFVVSVGVGCASGVYVLCTAYGDHALRMCLGSEIHRHFLGDDWSHWPWHAWLNVPLVPILLLASRISNSSLAISGWYWLPFSLAPQYDHTSHDQQWDLRYLTSWPPYPIWFPFLYPFLRRGYVALKERLTKKVLGLHHRPERRTRRILWDLERFQGRVEIDWVDGEGNRVPDPDGRARGREQGQVQPQPQVVPEGQQEGQNQGDDDGNNNDVGTIHVTPYSFGRLIGGALLLPTISSFMGFLIYRAVTRWKLTTLQKFFGIRTHWQRDGMQYIFLKSPETWRELDPVYWRNAVGLGLYLVAKDCLSLFHLWLKKREVMSRRIHSRNFAGMDTSDLDLIFPVVAS